jgi:5,10-methylene-tetrahydrofolate dehydrogenase/methenyl tetrahydrofolate cyclohydrolase
MADILVVAVGKPGLITADMVKPGVVVFDVGVTRVPDESAPRAGYRIAATWTSRGLRGGGGDHPGARRRGVR